MDIELALILGAIMGTGLMLSLDQMADPAIMQKYMWQNAIVALITAYPSLALAIKRRHDRNNNGYDAAALIILGVIYSILGALGMVAVGGAVQIIFGLIFLVLGIWVIIQLGFLKGTAGPNNYGPDPLGG